MELHPAFLERTMTHIVTMNHCHMYNGKILKISGDICWITVPGCFLLEDNTIQLDINSLIINQKEMNNSVENNRVKHVFKSSKIRTSTHGGLN